MEFLKAHLYLLALPVLLLAFLLSALFIGNASDNQLPLLWTAPMLRRGKGVYLKNGDRIQIGSAEVEFRLFKA